MATIASDAGRVYAAMRHGEVCKEKVFFWAKMAHIEDCFYSFAHQMVSFQVLVFNGCTFLLETVLEGRKEPVWQVSNNPLHAL